jgi:hypothetical protein
VDGGRTARTRERFVAHLRPGARTRAVVRLESASPTRTHALAGGREVAGFVVEPGGWVEAVFDLPADRVTAETTIELTTEGGSLSVFHYWFGEARGGALAPGR